MKLQNRENVFVEENENREVDVLRLIAQRLTNRQIVELLSISPRTLEGRRANLMHKLNLHSRVQVVEFAESHELLD